MEMHRTCALLTTPIPGLPKGVAGNHDFCRLVPLAGFFAMHMSSHVG